MAGNSPASPDVAPEAQDRSTLAQVEGEYHLENYASGSLLSVIIPTRERAETLLFTLQSVLGQSREEFEVIVSDNFSQDNTEAVAHRFADRRVRYFNTGRRISMCDNWEFALERAKGEYILFIGDDDAMMPGGVARLLQFIRTRPSPIYCWPLGIYTWPIDGEKAFVLDWAASYGMREIDLKERARVVISRGGWRYHTIPCMYHSAVARTIPDRIREKTGRVFHSTQPDVFLCFALPAFADKALDIGVCLTVHGLSQKSNGGVFRAKDGKANFERYVRELGNYKIHPTLFPEVPIAANLTPDAILVAMEKFPELYGKMEFNYDAMWAFICRLEPVIKHGVREGEVLKKRRKIRRYHSLNVWKFLFFCVGQHLAVLRRKFLRRTARPGLWAWRVPNNISDFVEELARLGAA